MRGMEVEGYRTEGGSFAINLFTYPGRTGDEWFWTVVEIPKRAGFGAQVIPDDPARFCGGHESKQEAIVAAKKAVDAYVAKQAK